MIENMLICPECGLSAIHQTRNGFECLDCGHCFSEAPPPVKSKPRWLVIKDIPGSNRVSPKRADWTEVEGKDTREAAVAFITCSGELAKMANGATVDVHVRPASSVLPCVVHTLTLRKDSQ